MIQINRIQKRKSVVETKKYSISGLIIIKKNKQIIMLKLPRQKTKYLVLIVVTASLTAVENEIPDVNNLVKKKKRKKHDAKILGVESKNITVANYKKFTKVLLMIK